MLSLYISNPCVKRHKNLFKKVFLFCCVGFTIKLVYVPSLLKFIKRCLWTGVLTDVLNVRLRFYSRRDNCVLTCLRTNFNNINNTKLDMFLIKKTLFHSQQLLNSDDLSRSDASSQVSEKQTPPPLPIPTR